MKKAKVTQELLKKAQKIFLNNDVVYTTDGLIKRSELRALRRRGYVESAFRGGPAVNSDVLGWYATDKLTKGDFGG